MLRKLFNSKEMIHNNSELLFIFLFQILITGDINSQKLKKINKFIF